MVHQANIDTTDFWKQMNNEKKKEYLHIDTLYNRQFLEKSRALLFGGVVGLTFSLLLLRVKNRFLLATLTSGLSCASFCAIRSSPVHSQYFKVWEHVKNDQKALDTIRSSSDNMSNEDFHYFYHRYLRFFYTELAAETNVETTQSK